MSSSALLAPLRAISLVAKRSPSSSLFVGVRGIAGKAMKQHIHKAKPWPYEKWEFNLFWYLFDRTTLRFDENTKLVVVDGAHAVGKTKFAQELAEELGMLYMPQVNMDSYYVSPYGNVNLREWTEYLMPRNIPYDEKDFFRNPLGPIEGCADRLHQFQYYLKYEQCIRAFRHMFNTGQGVVLERSPWSHKVLTDAAYRAGYIESSSMKYMAKMFDNTLHFLLRPNLIIYLDAPVDVVRKNIAARNNEWDKDSPVWANTQYLTDIYNTMKRDYLQKAKGHSQVLVYDWSEAGEIEIVVEDIERLNFDHYGTYEDQQKDWRFHTDENATIHRLKYSRICDNDEMAQAVGCILEPDAKHLYRTAEEMENLQYLGDWFPGHRYEHGYNKDMGDKGFTWSWSNSSSYFNKWLYPFSTPRRLQDHGMDLHQLTHK